MLKIAFFDIDGTLTDSGYFISEDSNNLVKRFSTRDFMGLQMLVSRGVTVAFISGAPDQCIDRKMEHLPSWSDKAVIHSGVSDKLKFVQNLYADEIDFSEMAFIGDDVNDLGLLEQVGIEGCPNDAVTDVINYIETRKDGFVMSKNGGYGAVREFCEMLLPFIDSYDKIEIGETDGQSEE